MNTYLAIRTAGTAQNSDFVWQTNSAAERKFHAELADNCDADTRSYAISRRNGLFDVFIGGIQSGLIDYRQRPVMVSAAFIGLSDSNARALLIYSIEQQSLFEQGLNAAIARTGPSNWCIDWVKVQGLIADARAATYIETNAEPFPDAWERFYTAPLDFDMPSPEDLARADEELKQLVQEVKSHTFSPHDGLKILVSRHSSQVGYALARDEADRFLWSDGRNLDMASLRKKKLPPTKPLPSPLSNPPSKLPSRSTIESPYQVTSRQGSWIPSKGGLLLLCGVIAITAAIVLLGPCKKKVVERDASKPASKQDSNVKPPSPPQKEEEAQKSGERSHRSSGQDFQERNPTSAPGGNTTPLPGSQGQSEE
jgi:hypothetical protein